MFAFIFDHARATAGKIAIRGGRASDTRSRIRLATPMAILALLLSVTVGFGAAAASGPPTPRFSAGPVSVAKTHAQLPPSTCTYLSFGQSETCNFNEGPSTWSSTIYDSPCDGSYSVTFDWGDGTPPVTEPYSGGCANNTFNGTASAQHTFMLDEGQTTTVTITATDPDNPSLGSSVWNMTMIEGDELQGSAQTISATEGQSFTGQIATFTNQTFVDNSPSDFTATIDWGDGQTSTVAPTGGSGIYYVSGTHTWDDEGLANGDQYTVTITLRDDGSGTAVGVATTPANVDDADSLSVTGSVLTVAREGGIFRGVVGKFADSNPNARADDFNAIINWGDGETDAGDVSYSSTTGQLSVHGEHRYDDEGVYGVSVTILEDAPGAATATANGTILVGEKDKLSVVNGETINATHGVQFSGNLGVFADTTLATHDATDFRALVSWGDGTITAGTISGTGTNRTTPFTVSGTHTYLKSGTYTVTVLFADDKPGTARMTLKDTATVQ